MSRAVRSRSANSNGEGNGSQCRLQPQNRRRFSQGVAVQRIRLCVAESTEGSKYRIKEGC